MAFPCFDRPTSSEELPDRLKASKKKQSKRSGCISQQDEQVEVELENIVRCYSEINELWRLNRRPLRRRTMKANNLERLTDFIHFSSVNK